MTRVARAAQSVVDDLGQICEDIGKVAGIQLGERQRTMVESRLKKRALDLGIGDIHDYYAYYQTHRESELSPLISLLTTHHTYFFREFSHFEFLEKSGIRDAVEAARARGEKKIRIWSAACSRGQECYSLSMFLAAHLPRIAPDFTYEIIGTDIDPESVKIAQNGVYAREEIKSVPLAYLGNHWVRGTGDISEFVKARASIKAACSFQAMNLFKIPPSWRGQKFDIVFCRNVFIYFNHDQIKEVSRALLSCLHPTGYLFVGISESLMGLNLPVKTCGPSIYTAQVSEKPSVAKATVAPAPAPSPDHRPPSASPAAEAPPVLRVFCIDDSPSVLTLLKQVLRPANGFEVVGTAKNGLDAATQLKSIKADVVTLDIHMPEQDGLTYLKRNHSASHPPVVMISSVSRDDAGLAMQCLSAGASDYVEKPVLANLVERGEEIRVKLRSAFSLKAGAAKAALGLDQSFAKNIAVRSPETKLRIILGGLSQRSKINAFFGELTGAQPPTVICVEGAGNVLEEFAKQLKSAPGAKAPQAVSAVPETMKAGETYLIDAMLLKELVAKQSSRQTSVLVYGEITARLVGFLSALRTKEILVEDTGTLRKDVELVKAASDIMPATSFAYMSCLYLSQDKR